MHDEWIIARERTTGRNLLVHAAHPWFACTFAERAEAAGPFFGLTVEMPGRFFCNFRFQGGLPSEETLRELCVRANDAIDAQPPLTDQGDE